jgi:hypothetical protein
LPPASGDFLLGLLFDPEMKAMFSFETSGSLRAADRDSNCDKEEGMETDLPTVFGIRSVSSERTGQVVFVSVQCKVSFQQ